MLSSGRQIQSSKPKIPSIQMPLSSAAKKKTSTTNQRRRANTAGRGQSSRQTSADAARGRHRSQQQHKASSGKPNSLKVGDVLSLPLQVVEAEYDSDDNGQDIKFFNVPSSSEGERTSGALATPRDVSKIEPQDILAASQESDPSCVYDINLHASNIKLIEHLEQFTRVRVVDLSCNFISKIQNLTENKELRELKLYGNKITQIENLDSLKELCHLQLQHNRIRSLGRGLCSLRRLRQLRLDSNLLQHLEPRELATCPQLISLDISSNSLENINAVTSLPNLEELSVRHNKLRTITDLSRCRRLQEVDMSHNRLTDISGLKGLPLLLIVNVSHNQLSSVKSLGKLKGLQELVASHNRLTDLSAVPDLFPALQILDVSSNMIEDANKIKSLERLSELAELSLTDNPFMKTLNHTYMADVQKMLPQLEVLDGIFLKKPSSRPSTPLMRPMTASTVVTARQVEGQLRAMEQELDSFQNNLASRFESLRATVNSLPAEAPSSSSLSVRSDLTSSRPASKCGKRSRLAEARAYAAQFADDTDSS